MSDVIAKGKNMAKQYIRGDRIYVTYTLNGKRMQKSTGLSNTAENRQYVKDRVLPDLEYRIMTGDFHKKKENTFKYYYDKWLPTKEKNRNYTTVKSQSNKVLEAFGNMKIRDITRLQVKEYLFNLDMKNYSKQAYLSCFNGVFEMALDDEAVDKNVAHAIKLGKSERKQVDPFSPEEVELVLSNAKGMLKNYLGIAFYTGMRPSEILGLMRQDIKDNTISINRSVSHSKIGATKNLASKRIIPMFDIVKPYIEDQLSISNGFFLFERKGNHLWDIGYFRKDFYKLLNNLELRKRNIYDTRHTFATSLLNSGQFRIMDIAALLGHTNANMIMTIYSGFIKGNHLKIDTDFEPHRANSVTVTSKTS